MQAEVLTVSLSPAVPGSGATIMLHCTSPPPQSFSVDSPVGSTCSHDASQAPFISYPAGTSKAMQPCALKVGLLVLLWRAWLCPLLNGTQPVFCRREASSGQLRGASSEPGSGRRVRQQHPHPAQGDSAAHAAARQACAVREASGGALLQTSLLARVSHYHKECAACLKHRKHVLCEKALAVNCVNRASVLNRAITMERDGQDECSTLCKDAVLLRLQQGKQMHCRSVCWPWCLCSITLLVLRLQEGCGSELSCSSGGEWQLVAVPVHSRWSPWLEVCWLGLHGVNGMLGEVDLWPES